MWKSATGPYAVHSPALAILSVLFFKCVCCAVSFHILCILPHSPSLKNQHEVAYAFNKLFLSLAENLITDHPNRYEAIK